MSAQLAALGLVGEYVDAGVASARAARPALDKLTAAAAAGGVDVRLVAQLDRLGRNLQHLLTLMQQLDSLGIRVISAGGRDSLSWPHRDPVTPGPVSLDTASHRLPRM